MAQDKQQTQDKQPAETIKQQLPILQWRMDYFRSPEDAVLKWDVSYEKWFKGYFGQLVKEVAQATGADPAQIANKATRTPEQDKLLTEAAARRQIARIEAFFDSAYMDALTTLDPLQGAYNDPNDPEMTADAAAYISVKEQAVLYFFATHDSIKPTEPTKLTEEQREELAGIYKKLDAYYAGHATGDPVQSPEILFAFIEQENPAMEIAESNISVRYKKTTEIKTITDKLATVFFSLMAPASSGALDGQRQMTPLRYEGKRSKKEITVFYDYIFDEELLQKYGIVKKFDDFDFLVMTIIDNLYTAGNDIVSYTKIYYEMGGEGSPTSKQLEPIYYSLLKGMSTTIMIDDAEAQKAWKVEPRRYHEVVSHVMPIELANERLIVNGRLVNGYVKINDISPFMKVAKPLGHLTAWDKDVLKLYKGRKTKRYYSVMRFLMIQIGWMRNSPRSRKILYSTLYKHTGDTTTRAQQLTRDMMYRLLDEVFIPAQYVKGYKEIPDPTPGVELTLLKSRHALTE